MVHIKNAYWSHVLFTKLDNVIRTCYFKKINQARTIANNSEYFGRFSPTCITFMYLSMSVKALWYNFSALLSYPL